MSFSTTTIPDECCTKTCLNPYFPYRFIFSSIYPSRSGFERLRNLHHRHRPITPVPKPGDPTQPTNYRPISLLSTTSKIQEKMLINSSTRTSHPTYPTSSPDSVRNTALSSSLPVSSIPSPLRETTGNTSVPASLI